MMDTIIEKLISMYRKIMNLFVNLMCLMLVTLMGVLYIDTSNLGGLDMNKILAVLLWIGLGFIFVKISPRVSAAVAFVIYVVVYVWKFEWDEQIVSIVAVVILGFVLDWYIKKRTRIAQLVYSDKKKGIIRCPKCGSDAVYRENASNEFTNDFNYDGVRIVHHHKAHWVCNCCGHEF